MTSSAENTPGSSNDQSGSERFDEQLNRQPDEQPGWQSDQGQPINSDGSALHAAIRTLTANLSLEAVLQQVADLSRELVSANYSALGILGADSSLVQFITSGISQADRDRIGAPPVGKGVLGVVLLEGQSLRLHHLGRHPETIGFPAHHPPMNSFLGVPITFKGTILAN